MNIEEAVRLRREWRRDRDQVISRILDALRSEGSEQSSTSARKAFTLALNSVEGAAKLNTGIDLAILGTKVQGETLSYWVNLHGELSGFLAELRELDPAGSFLSSGNTEPLIADVRNKLNEIGSIIEKAFTVRKCELYRPSSSE